MPICCIFCLMVIFLLGIVYDWLIRAYIQTHLSLKKSLLVQFPLFYQPDQRLYPPSSFYSIPCQPIKTNDSWPHPLDLLPIQMHVMNNERSLKVLFDLWKFGAPNISEVSMWWSKILFFIIFFSREPPCQNCSLYLQQNVSICKGIFSPLVPNANKLFSHIYLIKILLIYKYTYCISIFLQSSLQVYLNIL